MNHEYETPYVKRLQETNNYHLTMKEAINLLTNSIVPKIQTTTKLPEQNIKIRPKEINGITSRTDYKTTITIGIKSMYMHRQGDMVRDRDFVLALITAFHEQKHALQLQMFMKETEKPNQDVMKMAHVELLRRSIPAYYRNGYYTNINEIDAELSGIQNTYEICKNNFPEIDVNTEIVNLINVSMIKWNTRHVYSTEDAMNNLTDLRSKAYEIYVPLPDNPNDHQSNFRAFQKDRSTANAYENLKDDPIAANRLLLDFIKEREPWRYLEFPYLKSTEWTESVRNSKKPLINKILSRREQEEIANAYFGHVLDQIQDNGISFER